MSTEEKKSSSMTKLTLTREQHKAENFWALKSVISFLLCDPVIFGWYLGHLESPVTPVL